MFNKLLILLCISLLASGTALAGEEGAKGAEISSADHAQGALGADQDAKRQVPDPVTSDNWAYREIAELAQKYAAEKKLEGKSCPRAELADSLLVVMEKIVLAYRAEGNKSLQREDLARIAALHAALEQELAPKEGYRTLRGTIQEILTLVEPDVPPFEHMVGVNGFIRGEGSRNFRLFPDLSYSPGRDEGRFIYRVKPYAYWHPTDYLDFHLEGQLFGYQGGSHSSVEASLYQGFVEARLPGHDLVALKGGRQEFVYGSAFILGADAAFDGLSYDAGRLRLRPTETVSLDIMGGRYAESFSGGVKGNMAGAYLIYAPAKESALEAYLLRDAGSKEHHGGEYLDIAGVRGVGKYGPFSLELEPVYESGKRFNPDTGGNDRVSAFGGHIDLNGEFQPCGYKTKLILSYAAGSGDKNPAKEFRNPVNDTSLVGDMHLVGDLSGIDVGSHHASGVQVYTLGWGVDLSEQVNFSATAHKFVASSVEDGFSRHLGIEADFGLTWAIDKDFSVSVSYDRFFAEKFFRDATGSDKGIDYFYAMLTFNFDKTKRKTPKP